MQRCAHSFNTSVPLLLKLARGSEEVDHFVIVYLEELGTACERNVVDMHSLTDVAMKALWEVATHSFNVLCELLGTRASRGAMTFSNLVSLKVCSRLDF